MSRVLRVAAVQGTAGTDVAANRAAARAFVEEAIDRGARYVQVPEYATYYGPASGFAAAAEEIPGPTTRALGELAARSSVVVHVGSLLEAGPDPHHWFNSSVVIGADGEVVAATARRTSSTSRWATSR